MIYNRPTPTHIPKILANLSRPIPPPRAERAKPRKTWRRLQAGARLRTLRQIYLPQVRPEVFPPGTMGTILSVDSLGMSVALEALRSLGPIPELAQFEVRWSEPWEGTFEKVRVSKGRRSKK